MRPNSLERRKGTAETSKSTSVAARNHKKRVERKVCVRSTNQLGLLKENIQVQKGGKTLPARETEDGKDPR